MNRHGCVQITHKPPWPVPRSDKMCVAELRRFAAVCRTIRPPERSAIRRNGNAPDTKAAN